ncbi:MAG: PAS domain S-box protein [Bacteroidetes bacterium]|nr:PAS domain S-box protein [Bacteroidota bacterium]
MIIIDLVHNLLGLVALSVLSGMIDSRFDRSTLRGKLLQGTLFGLLVVAAMMYPYEFQKGVIFDGRSIVISLCSLFFGPVSGIITAVIALAYRVSLGGSGLLMGSLIILSSLLFGLGFHYAQSKGKLRTSYTSLYTFGILVHLSMLIMILALPSSMLKETYNKVTLTIIIVYPLMTLVIGKMLDYQKVHKNLIIKIKQDESLLKATLYSIGDAVITTDNHGIIRKMNRAAEDLTGWSEIEASGKTLSEVYQLVDDETGRNSEDPVTRVLRTGKVVIETNKNIQTSRNLFPIPVGESASPIQDDKGNIIGVVLIFREQAEERATIKMLLETTLMFNTTFENSPVPMILCEVENGTITDVNSVFLRETGHIREELIGRSFKQVDFFADPVFRNEMIFSVLKTGKIYGVPFNAKTRNGVILHCLMSANIIHIRDKRYFLASILNITKQEHSDKIRKVQYAIANAMVNCQNLNELFNSIKTELSVLVDTSNFMIAMYDEQDGTMHSPFKVDEKDEVLPTWPASKSLSGYVVRNKKTVLLDRLKIAELANKGTIQYIGSPAECWLGAPMMAGDRCIGAIVVQSYNDPDAYNLENAELLEMIASQISIYIEKKRSEIEGNKLSKAIIQSPVSIVITDIQGNIEFVNPKFTEVTGFTLSEAKGQNPRILKTGKQDKAFYENLWNTILSGNEWQGEFHNRKKNGEEYWEKAIISPITNVDGTFTHFMAMKEDITESKKLHDELIIAKEHAEESERLKTAFLQNISHEIRTPLNGILGFAYMLNKDNVDESTHKKLTESMLISGKRLLELINNIIDLSKLESGSFELTISEFPLHKLLNEVCNQFTHSADTKGISIISPFEYLSQELIIKTDELKLHQILTNLLDNAMKFTKEGRIEIGYVAVENELIFSVRDTGCGIPLKLQSRIFDRFYQADMSMSRNFEGSGLGLAICKGLVEMLRGKIWFESTENVGTTFYFSIPCETGKEPQETKKIVTASFQNKYKKILIAEDDDFSFTFLETVLENEMVEIIRARTGVQAVEVCTRREDIDLVLMDIKMPEMNGVEATKKIKSLRPKLPVIAQTAYAFLGEKQSAIDAGCDDYITKPVSLERLSEALNR